MKTILLSENQLIIVHSHAQKADIGGASNIGERGKRRFEYQLTGMACEAAGWIALHQKGFLGWDRNRCVKNSDPMKGDGGEDLPRIDIKGSFHRYLRIKPQDYNLWVRNREYKNNIKYVLAIAEPGFMEVHLVGWSLGKDMQFDSENDRWQANVLSDIELLKEGQYGT